MQYFDFVMSEVHVLRIKELRDAQGDGRKVIGSFCVFVPDELILAVDGISVGLCAGAEFGFDKAEEVLPRKTCALIKSAFGFKLGKVCPYVESSDMIVGENTCVGERGTQWLTSDSGNTVEQLINDRVQRDFQIECAIFTPNPSRLEHIKSMVKKYKAQGVIHYSLQFCQPYQIESGPVERALELDGIPVLRIDTDYSQEDAGQIKTRVEAFIERIGDRK